ncbi:CUB domain-containing protein [Fibrobacter sp. UWB15]|uniref:InlB B-repeat-containing protein n=1 Tax=unclassified Fibrobacter TaxID=2634177 RepID=UPI0009174795|nr:MULTISPECIES: CUB domain-containing protein [unclassified Fibrobacter]PWJ67776.1 CUB-like protein [Fibrobacter sp. UWB6]SHF77772.1 CUB domain-containing protein [Fibrobacter sp. UWB8]SMG15017.1 CUB domain-containing protein [Fibrobacter sp. UWB15]
MKKGFHVFLFVLFAVLMSQSAWADIVSTNGAGVNVPCSGSLSVYVDDKVTYFYVYDDGGVSGNYSNNCRGYLSITAPNGKALKVETYNYMDIENNRDTLRILNSKYMHTDLTGYYLESMLETRSPGTFDPLYTTGTGMAIQFASDGSITNSGFVLKVSVVSLYSVNLSSSSMHIWDPYLINSVRVGYDDYSAFAAGAKVSLYDRPLGTGSFLTSLKVKDASGNLLPFKEAKMVGDGYGGDSLQFTMPSSNVTVSPTYTDLNNLSSVDMLCRTATLNIPSSISSFKIYDNGGSSENYTNNCDAYLTLKAPAGFKIKLIGTVNTENGSQVWDYLKIYNGSTLTDANLLGYKYSTTSGVDENIGTVTSSGNVMTLWFHSDNTNTYSGLNLTASLIPQTFSISKASYSNGSVTVVSSANVSSSVTITATPNTNYLLKSLTVTTASGTNIPLTKGSGNTWTFTMPGENVTIKPVFAKDTYTITYKTASGGSVSGATSAKVGNTVSVTATPSNSSYLLKDINVVSSENETVDVTSVKWYNNTSTFTMPYGNVTVTPVFTNDLSADGGLYIDMPKTGTVSASIPASVKSFKVYDDGGKSGSYSNNANGTLYLTVPDGYILLLTGNINTNNSSDYLQIYNGSSTSNADSLLGTKSGKSTCKFYSKARRMALKFVSDGSYNSSGLDLTVTLVKLNLDLANDGTTNFVNMVYQHKATLIVPANVSSFKIYDEGGKSGAYSYNNRDTLVLIAPQNHVLKLTGSVTTAFSGDTLEVYSGSTINSSNLLGKKRSTSSGTSLNIGKMVSLGRYMTLYFESDASGAYSGLDLNVEVVNDEYNITIFNAEGGVVTVAGGKTTAKIGSEVLLNVTNLSAGYLLSDIDIVDDEGDTVKITSGGNFANPSVKFIMPAGPVTVTPHFTKDWNVAGNLYINMPTSVNEAFSIPSGVQSFKVYDDGGKNGNYSNNYEHSLRLTPPSGYFLQLEGSISMYDFNDYLTVKDYADGRILLDKGRYVSGKLNAESMWLTFHSDASGSSSGLDLTVTVVPKKTVSVNTASGGMIQPSSNVATPGSTVTLTATMDSEFYFESVDIRDAENKKISYSLDYPWYSSNTSATITFTMPNSDVSVTPKFTNKPTAEKMLAINIPASGTQSITIPAAVKSFKIYDDGGKDGNYSNNNNGTLALTAPSGYIFELTGSIKTNITNQVENSSDCLEWQSGYDVAVCGSYNHWYTNTCDVEDNLNVYDGSSVSATPLMQGKYGCVNTTASWRCNVDYNFKLRCDAHDYVNSAWYSIGKIMSSNNKMTLNFKSGANGTAGGLDLTVVLRKINTNELDADDDGNQYVNMVLSKKATVNIPSGTTSFKIYDDGGKNGAYSNNNADTLVLKAPVGSIIELTGSINTNIKKTEEKWNCITWATGYDVAVCEHSSHWYANTCDEGDNLSVYDGSSTSASKLLNEKYGCSATSSSWSCRLGISWSSQNCGAHSNVSWLSVGTLRSTGNTMTLVFNSNSSGNSDGLDLTAKVIMLDYAIQIKNATNGSMMATKTSKLHAGDTVSLIAAPNSGYLLKDVVAKDLSGNTVKVSQYSFSVSELVMPAKDLVITPTFTNDLTAAGGLHLDMRKNKNFDASFTEGVKSFKVYDNGGKNGVYEANSNDTLTLAAPNGYRLKLTGSAIMENGYEYLYVYDGENTKAQSLLTITGSANSNNPTYTTNISAITSSGRHMTLRFKSDGTQHYAGLDLTVTLEKIDYSITLNQATGGTLSSDVEKATNGAKVSLNGTPVSGYRLSEATYVNASGLGVVALMHSFDQAVFTMPASNVNVYPTWTTNLTAEGGIHLDMPRNVNANVSIPSDIKSFNLYDNGGKSGKYENSSNDVLTLNAPRGHHLVVTGSIVLQKGSDSLYIYDGKNTSATKLFGGTSTTNGSTYAINTITSSGESLTFRFKSDGSTTYSGLNLKVSVELTTYGIAIADAANGRVSSDKTKAAKDSIVNLSWLYTTGYLIRDIDVRDASNNKISVNGGWYSGARANFTMPGSSVIVTPSFTKNLTAMGTDGLYINMPATGKINAEIPANVKSFKVYDDGGKDNDYSLNCSGTLVLTAPEGYVLELSGKLVTENPYSETKIYDYLSVYDGADKNANIVRNQITGTASVETVRSSGRNLTLFFYSDVSTVKDGLDLTVSLVRLTIDVAEVTGGIMTSDKNFASPGEIVSLTASAEDGYLFDGVSVEDEDGNAIALDKDIHWYSNVAEKVITFSMPANSVTVTPKFSAINDLYVKVPTSGTTDVCVPENVTSFKVYDDGGKDENYSHNIHGKLNITSANSANLGSIKVSGTVATRKGDKLSLSAHMVLVGKAFYTYEGSADGKPVDIGTYTNTAYLLVDFESGETDNAAGLDLTVEMEKPVSEGGSVAVVFDDAHLWTESEKIHKLAMVTDGDKGASLNILEDIDVDSVYFAREFTTGIYSTIVFPAEFKADSLTGVQKVLRFNGFKQKDDGTWVVRMKRFWTLDSIGRDIDVNANTPYLVVMDVPKMVVRGGVTLRKTVEPIAMAEDCNWKFIGTLSYQEWPEGNPLVYGFKDNQFVKAGANVSVKPLRAYLLKPEPKQASGRPSLNGFSHAYEYIAPIDNPDEIDIVEDDDEVGENTTVIGRFNTSTGEFRMLPSYDIKGRKLNGKPNVHKAYYGKKVIRK